MSNQRTNPPETNVPDFSSFGKSHSPNRYSDSSLNRDDLEETIKQRVFAGGESDELVDDIIQSVHQVPAVKEFLCQEANLVTMPLLTDAAIEIRKALINVYINRAITQWVFTH